MFPQMQPGPMMMNPMCGYGGMNPGGMNQGFQAQNLMGGWSGVYNNMNNANQPQPHDKMNVFFKRTNGSITNVQVDYDKSVGELICIFLKKMGSQDLIGNETDICFLNNATKIKYNDKRKVRDVFKFTNPTIMVNDVKNLIGAVKYN